MTNHISDILLARHLDGTASVSEKATVETHAGDCPGCRKKIDDGRMVKDLLARVAEVRPGPAFDEAFLYSLRRQERERELAAPSLLSRLREGARYFTFMEPARARAAAAAAAILLALVASIPFLPGRNPTIVASAGRSEIYSAGAGRWTSAGPGTVVGRGDIIRVHGGGYLDIALGEVYFMRVAGGSEVIASRPRPGWLRRDIEFGIDRGEMIVGTGASFGRRALNVDTPAALATATGTFFRIAIGREEETLLQVKEGTVLLRSKYAEDTGESLVTVRPGTKSEVFPGSLPEATTPMTEYELQSLSLAYERMGFEELEREPSPAGEAIRLILLEGPDRVEELFQPCPILVRDVPDGVLRLIEESQRLANSQDYAGAIQKLREVLARYPDPRYNSELKLYLGAQLYTLLHKPEEAIAELEDVARHGKEEWRSLALAAVAEILKRSAKEQRSEARDLYKEILNTYPDSPESQRARAELKK